MFNPAPIIIAVYFLSRRKSQKQGSPLTLDAVLNVAVAVYAVIYVIASIAMVATGDFDAALTWTGATAVLALVWFSPRLAASILRERVAVPRGMVRLSSFLGWFGASGDRRGGRAFAAARALCHANGRDPSDRTRVERLIGVTPLRASQIAAQALVLAAANDRDACRSLLRSLAWLDVRVVPVGIRRRSEEWLVADAAERGDWRMASTLRLTPSGLGRFAPTRFLPRTTGAAFVAAAARRVGGGPGGILRDGALVLRWLIARHHRRTLPLLRRAIAAPGSRAPEEPPQVMLPDDPARRALALHALVTSLPQQEADPAWIQELAGLWTVALARTPSIPATVMLRDQIVADLAAVVRRGRRAIDGPDPILERARRLLRDRLLDDVESASSALRERAIALRELPPIEEWREYVRIRSVYEEVTNICGSDARRLAFGRVHADVCKLACWLFNKRRQRPIANGMFRWLLQEAEAVGTPEDVKLEKKNVSCGVA